MNNLIRLFVKSFLLIVLFHLISIQLSAKIITLENGDKISWDGTYYDFKDAEGHRMIKLWIPPNTAPLKGIFISGHGGGGGDSRNFARDENIRAFAMRLGFGVAGMHNFPGRKAYEEGAEIFFKVLDKFASLGLHPELSNIPFVMYGSSNGGSQTYGFVNYAPEKAICFVANVSAGYVPIKPVPEAMKVPGIFIMGKFDALIGDRGINSTKELISEARKNHARWAWALELKGHEDGASFDVYMKMVEQSVKERYPAEVNPVKEKVVLKTIKEKDGWLADQNSWESGFTYIDSYEDYKGNKSIAGWLLNKDIAFVYRSMATHHNPLSLSVDEFDKTINPYTDPGTMFSLGGPVVKPGTTVNVKVEMKNFDDWQKIELFNGSYLLGSMNRTGGASLKFTLTEKNQVYCLTAVAENADRKVASAPVHFFIEDTTLNWHSNKEFPEYGIKNTRSGSKNLFANQEFTKPNLEDNILVAYALSEQYEKQFSSADNKISEFWSMYGDENDRIELTQLQNTKRGEAFNFVLTNDCNMHIRAAYGNDGLYLLFVINDDNNVAWPNKLVGTEMEQFYSNFDAVDVLIDSRSVNEIVGSEYKETILFKGGGLTVTTKQYQIACGTEDERPAGFKRTVPDPWDFHSSYYEFGTAARQFGIEVENIKIDHYHKAQEWFLPWSEVGEWNEEPPAGTRFGFSGGFNDRDKGEHFPPGINSSGGTVKASNGLRWIDNTDPWGSSEPPYAWGEIELGEPLK
jgi:hypothetical protein